MGNQKTLPFARFKSRMRDQGTQESRCVSVQNTISDSDEIQIFLQWAGQNPYFSGYGNKNVKFYSWAINKRYRMRG